MFRNEEEPSSKAASTMTSQDHPNANSAHLPVALSGELAAFTSLTEEKLLEFPADTQEAHMIAPADDRLVIMYQSIYKFTKKEINKIEAIKKINRYSLIISINNHSFENGISGSDLSNHLNGFAEDELITVTYKVACTYVLTDFFPSLTRTSLGEEIRNIEVTNAQQLTTNTIKQINGYVLRIQNQAHTAREKRGWLSVPDYKTPQLETLDQHTALYFLKEISKQFQLSGGVHLRSDKLIIFQLETGHVFQLQYGEQSSLTFVNDLGFDVDDGFYCPEMNRTVPSELQGAFNEWKTNDYRGDLFDYYPAHSYHPVLIYLNSDGKSFTIHLKTPTLPNNEFYKLCTDSDPIHPIFKEAMKASTHEDVWRILHFIKSNTDNCVASIGNILHLHNTKYGHALFIGFGMVKGAAHSCSTDAMIRFVEKVDKNECRKIHIINEYSNELAGHATVYTHGLFKETKALLTGKRKIFANLRAWWNNDGILLADTRALLAGKRPFMANTRNYLFGNSVHFDEKSICTSNLHPQSAPQKAARKTFVEGMSRATLNQNQPIATAFFHSNPTRDPAKPAPFDPNLVDQIFDLAGISNPEKSSQKKKRVL